MASLQRVTRIGLLAFASLIAPLLASPGRAATCASGVPWTTQS